MKNLGQMMKQAQEMQAKMGEMQERLAELEVDGAAGGGMIAVTLSGKGDVRSIKIDPSLLVPDEAEILEDLIAAARSEEHTSELQSLMRISYAVFCLKKKRDKNHNSTQSISPHAAI